MEHIILFFYIFAIATGFSGLISLFAMRLRIRSRIVLPFLILYALFSLGLALVLIYFYVSNILSFATSGDHSSVTIFTVVSSLINASLYIAILRLRNVTLSNHEKKQVYSRTLTALCGAAIVLIISHVTARLIFGNSLLERYRSILSIISYILIGAAILSLGITLHRAALTGEHSSVRFLVKGASLCCFVFPPLSILEYLAEKSGLQSIHPLSIEFIVFFVLSGVCIKSALTSITTGLETRARIETIKPDQAARYGLTARETDMILLIARGLTNKAIAAELCISAATVRTHIYNLFQKVGVQSRIDLLNRFSQE